MYKKSYHIPLYIDETTLVSTESGREKIGNLGVRITGNGSPVGKKVTNGSPVGKKVTSAKKKVKSPEVGEVIAVKKDLRMELEKKAGEKREKERKDRAKEKREREQKERVKREREESTGKERIKKRRRTVLEIQDTDAEDDDLISPVDVRRDSSATDSTGAVLAGGMFSGLESFENLELMDLAGLEDSADSDYIEEVSSEDGEDGEEEKTIEAPKRKKILLDSSQSSPEPLHCQSPSPRTPKPQKRKQSIYVPKEEPGSLGKNLANGLYESSDSRSVSPHARPSPPRGVGERRKSNKQRINNSGYTLPPLETIFISPSRSRHKSRFSHSPENTSHSLVSQPACLRMSLTGNDKDIFTVPLSEVLTPEELERAIRGHFPQPADTYIKLTDDRGDIIKLSFWKGCVWKDGLRVRVEYRDNTSGGSGSKASTGVGFGLQSVAGNSAKIGMVDIGVQTEEVEVYDIGWAEKREVEIVVELTERLRIKADQEVAKRTEMKVKEEREVMELKWEQERERERGKFREEKERLHQKERQREKELEQLELELQLSSQPQVKEAPALLSANLPSKSEKSMPTPNTTANTSRNPSTDLATPTKLQFMTVPLPLTAVEPGSPSKQQQPAQQQKVSPKKWSPNTSAGVESDSDLSLDLSMEGPKKRPASEKQKSKRPKGGHKNTPTAAAGDGELETPSWVLSSAKKHKSRECSLSLSPSSIKLKGRSGTLPSTGPKDHLARTQSQEELSLFIGSSQLTDSSVESSPGVRVPFDDELTPPQENVEVRKQTTAPDPAPVAPIKESTVRKGGTPVSLARRSGKAGLARGGWCVGGEVRSGRGSGGVEVVAEREERKNTCQEWLPLGGWIAQRPGENGPMGKR